MISFSVHGSFARFVLASACAAIPALALARQQRPQDLSPGQSDGLFGGAAVGPDSAHVVYAVQRGPDNELELHRVAIAGGSSTDAIGDPFLAPPGTAWRIGADGSRVVYAGEALQSAMMQGGASPVSLSDPATNGKPRDFLLTPDSRHVVYRAGPEDRYPGLFSVPIDGSTAPVALVAPNDRGEVRSTYRITPDGLTVVYVSSHEAGAPARLYATRLDGTATVVLHPGPYPVEDFELGADGTRVVYRCVRDGARVLCTVPVDGSTSPAWLSAQGVDVREYELGSDGGWVGFLVGQGDGRNELFGVAADGSAAPRRLARGVASTLRIHPAGLFAVYAGDHDLDERFELYGIALDGSVGRFVLSAPLAPQGHVGWFDVTADGTRVVYQAYRGGSTPNLSDLWSVSFAQGVVRTRIAEGVISRDPQLSPSGGHVVYRGRQDSLNSVALAGGSAPVQLAPNSVGSVIRISPDGHHVLFTSETTRENGRRLLELLSGPIDGSTPPVVLADFHSSGAPDRQLTTTNVGYRDFSYGTTGLANPTAEKPQCKLWWNDGSWWASLYNDALQDHHIYRLDWSTQTWLDTGTVLDPRIGTLADVLWDEPSGRLYVASHIFSTEAEPTPTDWGSLFRYSYNATTRSYSLDAGFPVDITRGNAEALTIAKDSQGRLWATWVQGARPMINYSLASDTQWASPFVLPASATSVLLTPDDISAIVAFDGSYVGVMWSNQVTFDVYFAVHFDGDDPTEWQQEEVVLPDANCSGTCADDHFNLKADSTGRVYAVVKTSLQGPSDALGMVVSRTPGGGWSSSVYGRGSENHTRPILLLDEGSGYAYVIAGPTGGGPIYIKQASLADMQFEPGVGTPFIATATDTTIRDATSTKQNLDSRTGLVVLASDENTRYYLHNALELGAAAAPAITSFTPVRGPVGTPVTITGTGFDGADTLRFRGAFGDFQVVSSTQINATVPPRAATGRIGLTSPRGNASSPTEFAVTVAPTIDSFAPTSGPPGTVVAISGTHFAGTTSVRFNGAAASFHVLSNSEISVTVPGNATSGKITVTASGEDTTSTLDFTVSYAPPTVTGFSPTSGYPGTTVTILGTRFFGTTGVRFNGVPASFGVVSGTRIAATVPDAATTGKISITNAGGTGTSVEDFTVTPPPPTVTGFTPTRGPVGTQVWITGTRFFGTTGVRFGGTVASFTLVTNTLMVADVPPGAATGRIRVTNAGGTGASESEFTVLPPTPVVTGFSPASGAPGASVSISGDNFFGATHVRFNGVSAPFGVVSNTQLTATVPGSATSGRISVTNEGGTGTSAGDFTVTPPRPVITGFSPTSGAIGTSVSITGSGFTGATQVRFNGTPATFGVVSSTLIDATVPGGATTGRIAVTAPGGTATSTADFTVTQAAPTISSFSPPSGPVGTSVTISGERFFGTSEVRFNGTPASYTILSFTVVSAVVPAGATSGRISLTTPGGTVTSATDFTVTGSGSEPVLSMFTPTTGCTGTHVAIMGSNLSGATDVLFNGLPSSFSVVSSSEISAAVPAGATSGRICVTTPLGTATSLTDFVAMPPAPAIAALAPASGAVGANVSITGSALAGATDVRFNGAAAVFSVVSSSEITATVPAEATSGRISLTTPGGTATSAGDFTVVPPPPTITACSPVIGTVGTEVSIIGTDLGGTSAVGFNGTPAIFRVVSGSAVVATVPAGATSGSISLATPDGTATTAGDFTVTAPAPAIASFTPTSGPASVAVTISGVNFTGATGVLFNGVPASFTVESSTEIRTRVPAGATTGPIQVATPEGTASSTEPFTVGQCASDHVVELWPPNHKMVDLDLAVLLALAPADVAITGITQDEPVSVGVGDDACDGEGEGTSVAHIRAERDSSGNGRVYHVYYSALGGSCAGLVTVTVPHDHSGGAVDDGQSYDSYGGCD